MKSAEAERFIQEIQRLVDTKEAFSFSAVAKVTGYKSQDFTDIKAGKKDVQRKFLDSVAEKFPIDKDFVLTGSVQKKTSIAKHANGLAESTLQERDDDSPFVDLGNGQYIMIVPWIQEYGYAGYLRGFQDPQYIEELPKHSFVTNKQHKGKYVAITVIGDSMDDRGDDRIREGDVVTGREIQRHLWNARFHIHRFKDYIIVHKEGILIKRIIAHDVERGIITCHSLNPDKENYPDFEVNLDDCKQIFNIVNVTNYR